MADPRLLKHPLFRDASADRFASILDTVLPRAISRGKLLNSPGDIHGVVQLVLDGHLKAYQITADGRELLLELIEAGGFDGMLSMAGQRGHFTEAIQDSLVASIPWPLLEQLLLAEPRIARNLLWLVMGRLENREEHLESMALRDPTQRLARQLLALSETFGRREGAGVVLGRRLTHQTLADMLGLRRETVTLHLHRLVEMGAIQVKNGYFTLDHAALRRLVEEESPRQSPPADALFPDTRSTIR